MKVEDEGKSEVGVGFKQVTYGRARQGRGRTGDGEVTKRRRDMLRSGKMEKAGPPC